MPNFALEMSYVFEISLVNTFSNDLNRRSLYLWDQRCALCPLPWCVLHFQHMKNKVLATSLLILLLAQLGSVAASAQSSPSLPPGKYTYYGVDGKQQPLPFTIGADNMVHWETEVPKGTEISPLRAAVAEDQQLQQASPNMVRFPPHPLNEIADAVIQLTATFDPQLKDRMKWVATITNVPRPFRLQVFFLDENRTTIVRDVSDAFDGTQVPGTYKNGLATFEIHGQTEINGPNFEKMRDFAPKAIFLDGLPFYEPFAQTRHGKNEHER